MSEEIIDTNTRTTPHHLKENLSNGGGILTLGILSIVFAGFIGLILGIIGLSMSKRPLEMYRSDSNRYTESSYKLVNGGKICSIIGVSLSSLAILIVILALAANA